jgi:hypothetical protein
MSRFGSVVEWSSYDLNLGRSDVLLSQEPARA